MVGHAHISHRRPKATHSRPIPFTTFHCRARQLPGASDIGKEGGEQLQCCIPGGIGCVSVADECLGEQGNESGGIQSLENVDADVALAQQLSLQKD